MLMAKSKEYLQHVVDKFGAKCLKFNADKSKVCVVKKDLKANIENREGKYGGRRHTCGWRSMYLET